MVKLMYKVTAFLKMHYITMKHSPSHHRALSYLFSNELKEVKNTYIHSANEESHFEIKKTIYITCTEFLIEHYHFK